MATGRVSYFSRTSDGLRDGLRPTEESLDVSRAEVGSGLLRGDEHRKQQRAGDSDDGEHDGSRGREVVYVEEKRSETRNVGKFVDARMQLEYTGRVASTITLQIPKVKTSSGERCV